VITLDFTVKGSFSQGGLNNGSGGAGPGNTLMGENTGGLLNAYWVFDLAGITGPVVSATLRLGMPPFGYLSPDPTETITIFDYTGDIGVLQDQFAHSTAAFNNLGSGNVYGSRAVSDADEPDCSAGCPGNSFVAIDIALGGADFIDDINAALGGLFALGGALTSVNNADFERIFAFSGNNHPAQIIIETAPTPLPEPSSLALAAAGIAGFGFFRGARGRAGRSPSR